jgi:hypothetical protein
VEAQTPYAESGLDYIPENHSTGDGFRAKLSLQEAIAEAR